MKAIEELQLRNIEHCPECHCAIGDDWDYKDYSNREIIVCPQCSNEIIPNKELTALLRLKDNQWQVQWPEDNEFHNLVGWFETKTYEQAVEKLKSFPLNVGLKYKLIA